MADDVLSRFQIPLQPGSKQTRELGKVLDARPAKHAAHECTCTAHAGHAGTCLHHHPKEPWEIVQELFPELAKRESRVLAELATGKTDKEIGAALGLAVASVKVYLRTLSEKLCVENRTKAALLAAHRGVPAFPVRGGSTDR